MVDDEPSPPDPAFPRYTRVAFPAYRYVPGRSPHPRRDPGGHSYGRPEPRGAPLDPAAWSASSTYLYGADLYNFAYWWEAHESFEALWQMTDKEGPLGQMLQGLIQIAAGNLKQFMGAEGAAQKLWARGVARLAKAPSPYLGMNVRLFERQTLARAYGWALRPALIEITLPW